MKQALLIFNPLLCKSKLKEMGKSMRWLAEKVRVQDQTVRAWFCGLRNPSQPALEKVYRTLKINLKEQTNGLPRTSNKSI